MLIHNADITGSLTINGIPYNTGSFSGSFTGIVAGTTSTASYVEYNNVANKPALVSGSSQITYSGLTGIPSGIVSGSSQVTYSGLTGIPSGIVSGSAQIAGLGYATTSSNTFIGNQTITGSVFGSGSLTIDGCITATGQIVAQTINVQQVTSSIVYSCGSNIFGNSLSNTQQFTGSVGVTGSLTVAGAGTFTGALSGTSASFKVNADRNLAIKYDTNIALSAQSDSGAPESLRIYADTFRLFTATTAVGLTERLTISNTGAACFACELTAKSLGTNDLILNNLNHDHANYVDGTRGSWLIQEGACDLFIINQVSCKKYKFNLIEIK